MKIHLNRIGKRFNREWIFRDITATFLSGQAVAIKGPNGSGKSTLLSVLWSQTPPSEGEISYRINDQEIDAGELYSHLSLAAPYMDLLEDFTLREHLDFHFSFKACATGSDVTALMERMDMQRYANQQVRTFSSGMKQRLRLALALYSQSEVTFLDEPTTNLDESGALWYHQELSVCRNRLIFIASNTGSDFPDDAISMNLPEFKLSHQF